MKNVVLEFNSNGNDKQKECGKAWANDDIDEVLYGGAKGGGKSFIGCSLILADAMMYAGTHYFIARKQLNDLRKFTIPSIHEVLNGWEIPQEAWKYNGQDNFIRFKNGSQIDMLDLRYLPRDPLYERYGSVEYTGGWIEEGGEVNFGAFDVLKTRVGRHLNDEYNLTPKIFITCNPKKNWMYSYFYKPSLEGKLTEKQTFLQAFVQENPFIGQDYIEQLESTSDKAKKERLLKGNWEYDDNPYKLCIYDKILESFTNSHIEKGKEKYITADVARFGSDKAVIGVWEGWELIEVYEFEISKTTEIQSCIQTLQSRYNIPKSNCIVDADGVGGGVVDNLGVVGFVNNARPFDEEVSEGRKDTPKYRNLQTQMLVYLAERIINENKMYISAELSEQQKEHIKEELDTIERIPDTDVVTLLGKEDIKQGLGRSPDYRDMILMRCYFEFKKPIRNNLNSLASFL